MTVLDMTDWHNWNREYNWLNRFLVYFTYCFFFVRNSNCNHSFIIEGRVECYFSDVVINRSNMLFAFYTECIMVNGEGKIVCWIVVLVLLLFVCLSFCFTFFFVCECVAGGGGCNTRTLPNSDGIQHIVPVSNIQMLVLKKIRSSLKYDSVSLYEASMCIGNYARLSAIIPTKCTDIHGHTY